MTIGGLHGIVDSVDEAKVIIKCGDGSRLTYERNAIRDVRTVRNHKVISVIKGSHYNTMVHLYVSSST